MPQDTIWIDYYDKHIIVKKTENGNHLGDSLFAVELINAIDENITTTAYHKENSYYGDSLLNVILKKQKKEAAETYAHDKKFYDELGGVIQFIILLCAIGLGYYAFRRAEKYKRDPFLETEEWVEIGTKTENTFENFIEEKPEPKREQQEFLTYFGSDLQFTREQIVTVLDKRFPYFKNLSIAERTRFYNRLKLFMKRKVFRIHDKSGFKEMPILLSATAIQLSFGLDEYLLPHYKNIHIFPKEFLGIYPTIRFLEGNVSGNSINVSWKHFLDGYENTADGLNVGLHEFAHAYHAQNFSFEGERDTYFINQYTQYTKSSNKIFEKNKPKTDSLFTDNAFRNQEEFWAETVELFFEKPKELKEKYVELYESMSLLLKQRP
jgi:MtfA peptidase